jgi:hypothetical protein
MNPIRRELLNGMFVLVVASLLSAAFAAFQVTFNLQLFVFIVIGVAIGVGGYVVFEFVLSAEEREKEWLKRVGTPARLELNQEGETAGIIAIADTIRAMSPSSVLYRLRGWLRITTRERGQRCSQ